MRSSLRRWPLAGATALVVGAGITLVACNDEPTRPATVATQGPRGPAFAVAGGPIAGAIFTTTPNGGIVNENVRYEAKIEVYLDGGPGPHAPATAAGLTSGDYVFQITDPSGAVLLSEDPALCRQVRVSGGVITQYLSLGLTYGAGGSKKCDEQFATEGAAGPAGKHDVNQDLDHGSSAGAIVVQMMPFYDTPNPGGVYKAWMTPLASYTAKGGSLTALPSELKVRGKKVGYDPDPGFGVPRAPAKTDNFKVLGTVVPPLITVAKFHDANMNGVQDAGEASITGWPVTYDEPAPSAVLGVSIYTPASVVAALPGSWPFTEGQPSGIQTVGILDGVQQSLFPTANPTVTVTVAGTSGETHAVVFGDVGTGSIKACKIYDNATNDPIQGWKVSLTRTKDAAGNAVSGATDTQLTGSDGCYTWANQLPGEYLVQEVMAIGYAAVGPTSHVVVLTSSLSYVAGAPVLGATMTVDGAAAAAATFRNRCFGTANFGTKGYWSNQNGVTEMTQADIDFANTLDPFDSPTSYYGGEPFEGHINGGGLAPAAPGNVDAIAAANAGVGTAKAEVSYFLTLSNAGGDPRQQLAQQLLAFIFNSRHRLTSLNDQIVGPDLTVYTAQGLINSAVSAWQGSNVTTQNTMQELLNWFNNHESTPIQTVQATACPVVY